MLNEDKIKLMVKLAVYEKRTGKKTMRMAKYFRSDYISWNIIKTVFAVTAAYAIMVGIWLLYHIEEYMADLYSVDYEALIHKIGVQYIVVLVCYLLISYVVYSVKYTLAMKSLKRFHGTLKKIKQAETTEMKGRE